MRLIIPTTPRTLPAGLKNPITGVACCARTQNGHAAAPPSIVTKSRRLIVSAPSLEVHAVHPRYHVRAAGCVAPQRIARKMPGGVKVRSLFDEEKPLPQMPKSNHRTTSIPGHFKGVIRKHHSYDHGMEGPAGSPYRIASRPFLGRGGASGRGGRDW